LQVFEHIVIIGTGVTLPEDRQHEVISGDHHRDLPRAAHDLAMVACRGPAPAAQQTSTLVAGRGAASVHYLLLAAESPEDTCHMLCTYKPLPTVLVLPSQFVWGQEGQQHTGVG